MTMPARRVVRRRSGFRRGRQRGGSWGRFLATGNTAVGVSTKVLLTTGVLFNANIAETVKRTRGHIWVQASGTGSELQFGAFGLILASDAALAAGAASLPGPSTDASDDGWFVWQGFHQGAGDPVGYAGPVGYHYFFDSRAQRRIEPGYGVAVMVENASATFALEIGFAFSSYAVRS